MTNILVIRKDDRFSTSLREAGFNVVNIELIETRPLEDLSELRDKLAKLSEYDGLFFTSPIAAEIFVNERNGSNGFYGGVYALGGRAAAVLKSAGLEVRSPLTANSAEEMLSGISRDELQGKRFLFVCGDKSLRTIPNTLSDIAVVDEVAVYKTEPTVIYDETIHSFRSRLVNGDFELACFFSPSGVLRFAELFGDAAQNVNSAVIGSTTADAATQAGLKIKFISPRSNADDFARGLIEHIKNIE